MLNMIRFISWTFCGYVRVLGRAWVGVALGAAVAGAQEVSLTAAGEGLLAVGVRVPEDVSVVALTNFPNLVPCAVPVTRIDSRQGQEDSISPMIYRIKVSLVVHSDDHFIP